MTVDTATAPRPAPTLDEDSAFYWRGLSERLLLAQRCLACERPRFPPMPSCPYCAAPGSDVIRLTGAGRVYSWVVVHRAFNPAFAPEVPYTVATVDLLEGPRVVARLEEAGDVRAGMPVNARFVEHGGWTELRFGPAADDTR